MSDDNCASDTEHQLYRLWDERYKYDLVVQGGELLADSGKHPEYISGNPLETYRCECGKRFRKEETAIKHIRSVDTDS